MFCWSCGEHLPAARTRCPSCGAETTVPAPRQPLGRGHECRACGYLGDGMPYFRRSEYAALLVGLSLVSYGIGGLIYWLVRRDALVCPSCGSAWEPGRETAAATRQMRMTPAADGGVSEGVGRDGAVHGVAPLRRLPRSGSVRRTLGGLLGVAALFFLVLRVVSGEAGLAVLGVTLGLAGGASYAWGLSALQHRREGLLEALQSRVLQVARARAGRLTATDVAADLDMTLPAAEGVLFSMDDGFRVRSDVTDDGILVFDFPEIRTRSLQSAWGSAPGEATGLGQGSKAS